MKKAMSILLSAILVCALFAGCGGSKAPADLAVDAGKQEQPSGALVQNVEEMQSDVSKAAEKEVAADAKYKDTVVIGAHIMTTIWDPQQITQANPGTGTNFKLTHDTLVGITPDGELVNTGLAESWEQIDDITWKFDLYKGVKFSNGEELKASDVVYTIQRAGEMNAVAGATFAAVKSAKADGDYTVILELPSANMDILFTLSDPVTSIVNEKACKADPDKGGSIGTGAWILTDFLANDYANLVRNDNYRGEAPIPSKMTVRVIAEASARMMALMNKEIDVMTMVSNNAIPTLESEETLDYVTFKDAKVPMLAFNVSTGIAADPNFREAIAHALNYEEIAYAAMDGYAVLTESFWSPITFGKSGAEGVGPYTYDLDLAKELLAKTDYNGEAIEIVAAQDQFILAAQVIQDQLKKIGVNISVNELDYAGYLSYCSPQNPQHQLVCSTSGWANGGDSGRIHFSDNGSGNLYIGHDEEVLSLFDQALVEKDSAKRAEMYAKIQQINHDKVYYIPLYTPLTCVAMSANFGGGQIYATGWHDFSHCYAVEG